MPPKLRYEVYIPTLYNDRTPIELNKYRLIKNKLQEKFGGISVHPASVQGTWIEPISKQIFCDNCFRYEIVVEKTPENEEFFEKFKEELKQLLSQHEIFMISTEVNWI